MGRAPQFWAMMMRVQNPKKPGLTPRLVKTHQVRTRLAKTHQVRARLVKITQQIARRPRNQNRLKNPKLMNGKTRYFSRILAGFLADFLARF